MASGQGIHWLIESPTIFIVYSRLLRYLSFCFKHIHAVCIYNGVAMPTNRLYHSTSRIFQIYYQVLAVVIW